MASGQFVTVKLMRSSNETPWGFRLQGGLEFGIPLSVVKVTGGSLSEQSGIQVGDILLKINGKECDKLRHKDAQDTIISAGNFLELYLERGPMNTWRPSVTPVGDIRQPQQQMTGQTFTRTSLAKSPEANKPIGTGHNTAAKPFAVQSQPALVHKQYNSPVNLYSERNIEETLNAHTQVLATGATGINFMRPDAPVNKESAVFQMVQEEEMRKSKGFSGSPDLKNGHTEPTPPPPPAAPQAPSVVKHVSAPSGKPIASAADTPNRNICAECERLIVGVFVRINNKSLHAECFRCATCGTSLKNLGYFNINDKLYCDIHARQVKSVLGASATISAHTAAPAAESNYTNGHNSNPPNGFAAPQPALVSPPPLGAPIAVPAPAPVQNTNPVPSYHQPQSNTAQNGFHSYSSSMRKYSPVAPPTAPKPNFANRNSMYVSNPASYSVETHSTVQAAAPKSNQWPPQSSNTTENVVTYRQSTQQHSERPKSCFNLPTYSTITQSTYSTSTSNYPQQPNGTSNAPNYPKTATYASSTTTQKVIQPPSNQLPQSNFAPAAAPNAPRQWPSSTPSYGKVSDTSSAPLRGRGLLQTQLSGGVIPFCGFCSQPIRGQYIMALNKSFCKDHFHCANSLCKRPLEESGFVEEQGRLYCENCYATHFAPQCAKCNQRIKGDCLNALDRKWHTECFRCSKCSKPFGNSSFYLEDGFPYCEQDWNDLFTTKCVGCGFPIAAGDRWVEALNQNYHSNCFKCTVCKGPLEGQSFFAKGGRPFCRAHAR